MMGGYDVNAPDVVIGGLTITERTTVQFTGRPISYADIPDSIGQFSTPRPSVTGCRTINIARQVRVKIDCKRSRDLCFQSARACSIPILRPVTTSWEIYWQLAATVTDEAVLSVGPLSQVDSVEYPSVRQYDNTPTDGVSIRRSSDSGMGTGCSGPLPCHLAGTSALTSSRQL